MAARPEHAAGPAGPAATSSLGFEAHYGAEALQPYVRERRSGDSAAVTLFELSQPRGDFSDPPLDDLLVCLSLSAHRARCRVGGLRLQGRIAAGTLCVAPPHAATEVLAEDPNRFLVAAVPARTAAALLSELRPSGDLFDFDALNAAGRPLPLAPALLHRLWEAAAEPRRPGRLYGDALLTALLGELALAACPGPARPRQPAGLAPWQVKRVTDHLMDNLASDTSLAELAGLVRLSPHHFCRAFKASTGLPPHRWRLMRRMERAAELLAGTDLPVSEVASRVGYEDPSHLAAAFRAAHGVSPSRYRRERTA